MLRRLTVAVAIPLLLSACGGPPPEPPPPPPLDPTGTWDIMVELPGMQIGGTMIISGSAETGYTGDVDTDMGGAALSNIMVEGQTMTFSIPDAGADVTVTFDGDSFTGSMSGAMGDASLSGTRRSGG